MLNSEYQRGLEAHERAVEHAGYLADAAEQFMKEVNKFNMKRDSEGIDVADIDSLTDHWKALDARINDFRKRATAIRGLTPQPEIEEPIVFPDLKNLCTAGSPYGGGYPYCSLPKGHPGNKHIAYDSHDPTSDMLAEWETGHVEDSVEVPQPDIFKCAKCKKLQPQAEYCACGGILYNTSMDEATPPTPQPALCCPLCGASSPGVFWGRCAQYRDAGEPAHVFHWPSTSEASRAKMSAAPPDLDSLLQPLKDACDRAWGNETPAQIVIIAANAIYWRDEEIKKLRAGVPVEPQPTNLCMETSARSFICNLPMGHAGNHEAYGATQLHDTWAGVPVEPQPTKKWMHLPNEQTWWWHWNGEDLAIPHIYSVMVSKTLNDRYFIAYPDSRWCDELGGFWLKVQYPNVPSRTEQKSLAGVEQPTPKEAK